jgi:small-conductance mechanosensitive channel
MIDLSRFAQEHRPLLLIAGGLLAGFLAERLLRPALGRLAARTPFRTDDLLVDASRGLLWFWIALGGVLAAAPDLALDPRFAAGLKTFGVVAYVASATLFAARVAAGAVSSLASRGLLASTSILRAGARWAVFILGGLFLLQILGISIAPVLTFLGVGGLAIGLALKDTLSNFFAGIQILTAGNVSTGDYVKLESGAEGTIADIQWRVTILKSRANTLVVVPNAKMAESILINSSRPDPEISISVPFAVGYGVDLERIEQIAVEAGREVLRSVPGAAAASEPIVRFAALGESAVEAILILRAKEPLSEGPVRHMAVKRLVERLRAEGIAPPYPVRSMLQPGGSEPGPSPKT